ncbi:putative ribonuclease H-like domain-containing protein, partial [Tanacetum coccineum]
FSWTFFLRTKNETSAILKDFIRQIENQLNQKVKTIRCDNGTEFKNRDVIEFCGLKGIKREYNNARGPSSIVPDSIPEPTGENLGDHSSNDTSLSGNEDDMTLQNVYHLCISLCKQVTNQAKEIKLLKAKITKLKKQAKPVIKHHKEYLKIISLQQRFPKKSFSKKQRVHKKYVSKQGRKKAKGESEVQRDPLFKVLPEDKIDHMETENAQTEGRTRDMVDKDKEFDEERLSTEDEVSTVKEKVSTDESKVSTDEQVEGTEESNESSEEIFEGTEEQREGTEDKVSTDEQMEGTEDQTKEEIASKASQTSTQTPTSMTFGDDE